MSTISSSTTSTTAYKVTADTTGTLVIQTGATPTTAVTVDASQNVGIGTSSPNAKLQIDSSSATYSANIRSRNSNFGNGVVGAASNILTIATDMNNMAFYTVSNLGVDGTSAPTNERMRIDSSGNVGIGTTNPLGLYNAALAVVSPNTFGTVTVKCTSTTGAAGLSVQNDAGTSDAFLYSFNSASGSTNTGIGTSKNNPVLFYQNNTERMRIDTSGNLLFNSGYGSVATAYGCRAWVNFNGTGTVAIRASGNVSSITDNGVGDYTVNFTNAMPDGNYAYHIGSKQDQAGVGDAAFPTNGTPTGVTDGAAGMTTTRIRLRFVNLDGTASLRDQEVVCVSIFR